MSSRNAGRALASLIGAAFMMASASAFAQNARVEFLETQIDRLTRELQDLQREVYRGGTSGSAPAAAAGQSSAGSAGSIPNTALARIDERLTGLEDDLRSLRGELEQARHAVQQVTTRVDQLVADVDFRLTALEQGTNRGRPVQSGTAESRQGRPDGRPQPSSDVARALNSEGATGGSQLAPDERKLPEGVRSLGTIPLSELDNAGTSPADSVNGQPPAAGAGSSSSGAQQRSRQASLATPPAGAAMSPAEAYNEAYTLLKTARFDQAETALDSFIKTYPDHPLAENARYWLGETYYVRGDFERAALTFADGYKSAPEGGKAADNLLKLARSLAELGDKANACATLQRLTEEFPNARPAIEQSATSTRSRLDCS